MNSDQSEHRTPSPQARQRLLEGWLPLAEEASRLYGWNLDPAGLEALVLRAAPELAQSRGVLEARLCLWAAYQRERANEER
jgi:hypothetical protein